MQSYKTIYRGAAISLLLLLSGCWPFGKCDKSLDMDKSVKTESVDSSTALLSIKDDQGKTVALITEQTLLDFVDMASEAQPQMRAFLEMMPNAHEMLFKQIKQGALLDEWVKRKKIDQQEDYKKDLEKILKAVKTQLNAQYFQKNLKINVSDSEVKKYYNDHKQEVPGLIVTQGGVVAKAVFFDDEDQAKEFKSKLSKKDADIDALAKEYDKEVDDFNGSLNDRSFADQKVKDVVLKLSSFPSTDLIKVDDKNVAVVLSTSKKETEYLPFDDQVKEGLRNMLRQQKMAESFEKELGAFEKTIGAEENKEYFDAKRKEKEDAQKQMQEQMKQAQEQTQNNSQDSKELS